MQPGLRPERPRSSREEELRRESRAAARGLEATRPSFSGPQPAAGEEPPPLAFPGPRRRRRKGRALRGSAAAAEDQLLEEAEKEKEEPSGGGRGGRGPSGSRERHRVSAHLAPSAMAG